MTAPPLKSPQVPLLQHDPSQSELDSTPVSGTFEMEGTPSPRYPPFPRSELPLTPFVEFPDSTASSPRAQRFPTTISGLPLIPISPQGSTRRSLSPHPPPPPPKEHLMSWMDYERAANNLSLGSSPAATLRESLQSSTSESTLIGGDGITKAASQRRTSGVPVKGDTPLETIRDDPPQP